MECQEKILKTLLSYNLLLINNFFSVSLFYIKELAYLSLSYDHRIIDGADTVKFLEKLIKLIKSSMLK
jgi:hypothetical protein